MAPKTLLLLFFYFVQLLASLVLAQSDPQLEQCKLECRQQQEQFCDELFAGKQQGHGHRGMREEKQEGGEKDGPPYFSRERHGKQEEEEEDAGGRNNPYFFSRDRYIERTRTEGGNARLMERFSDRSELLRGVENYRVAIHEYNPNTFLLPGLRDVEGVYFVVSGRGTITFLQNDGRESHDIQRGDIVRVRSGISTYIHNTEKVQLLQFLKPVSTPGFFTVFFPSSSTHLESFYSVFSNEILEAAFKTPRNKLERLFGQKSRGFFLPAPSELKWQPPSPGQQKNRPYSLFYKMDPTYSNNHGQLHETNPSEFPQLQDLDVRVSYVNITKGAMFAPHYNSRSTGIAVVVEGSGYYEMASPNLSLQRDRREEGERGVEREKVPEQQQQQNGTTYQKLSARLSVDDVFIVPPAHPIVIVASRDKNLHIVSFEINAQGNDKFLLAGENNMMKHIERAAKELSFGVAAKEVNEVFNAQRVIAFLPGPEQQ